MQDFFRARTAEERKLQIGRLPFRNKFFAQDCRYDSHAGTLQRMESERVVRVAEGKGESEVITDQTFCYSGGEKTVRLRYHLRAAGEDWLIRSVETACFLCGGSGDASCPCCKGRQWLGAGQLRDTNGG